MEQALKRLVEAMELEARTKAAFPGADHVAVAAVAAAEDESLRAREAFLAVATREGFPAVPWVEGKQFTSHLVYPEGREHFLKMMRESSRIAKRRLAYKLPNGRTLVSRPLDAEWGEVAVDEFTLETPFVGLV